MSLQKVDAVALQKAFLAGAKCIESKKEYINELNVFPVPDGDTGTNMSLTIMAAAKEVSAIENPTIASITKAISSGSLRGARGNSGVILSQLFRGFCKETGSKTELTTKDIAHGFHKAVETAYKAVMKPKEGTILTVAKGAADKASEMARKTDDIIVMCDAILAYAKIVLDRTPDMLPVLKEAGVVDSGGQGLVCVLEGIVDSLKGKEIDYGVEVTAAPKPVVSSEFKSKADIETADIKFGYCTEFIIMLEKEFTEKDEEDMKAFLSSIGDSLVCVADDEIVKIHVHTNHPGQAFEKGLTYGQLTRMKVDNMREEHNERLIKDASKIAEQEAAKAKEAKANEPKKQYGFIAVSIGAGINEIFTELGVDHIIEGGQTMNPSTDDMLQAIDAVNAENIFILPNNKNIILAANQAQSLVEDKNIIVIGSKTVPQGISAMIGFNAALSPEENKEAMEEEMGNIKTGQVTYAVRDTSIDGKAIAIGDIMGISDDGLQSVTKDVEETTIELIKAMVDEDSELVCIYYGEEITEEQAEALVAKVEEACPDCDIDLQQGGQPIYYYVISVE